MKRNLTLLSALFLAGVSFAQKSQLGLVTNGKFEQEAKSNAKIDKAVGDVLYSTTFDFVDNWKSTAISTTPAKDFGWQLLNVTTADNWAFNPSTFNSTSKGGVAMCENGNPQTGTHKTGETYILELDSVLSFPGAGNLTIQFQQWGVKYYDNQSTQISVDGGVNWVEIGNNEDKTINTLYVNPDTKNYTTGPFFPVGTSYTNVRIRFVINFPLAQVDGIMYAWLIDDLKIIEAADKDLQMVDLHLADLRTEYEHTVLTKAIASKYPLKLYSQLRNYGVNTPTSVQLGYSITNTTSGAVVSNGTGGSQFSDFAFGAFDTVMYETGFDMSTLPIGTYNVKSWIVNPDGDVNKSNDTLNRTFQINENYFGQINFDEGYRIEGRQKGTGGANDEIVFGSTFYTGQAMDIYGYELYLDPTLTGKNTPDQTINIKLNEFDPTTGTFTELQAREFLLKAEKIPTTPGYYVFDFDSTEVSSSTKGKASLDGDKFYVFFVEHFGGTNLEISPLKSATDKDNSCYVYGEFGAQPGKNYFGMQGQLLYRMRTTKYPSTVGISEKSISSVNVYPNPSVDKVTVKTSGENITSVVITDAAGKVVYTSGAAGSTLDINNSTWNAGIYNAQITTSSEVSILKVVKQ